MAKLTLFSLALFGFLISTSCFADRQQEQQQFNECQLDKLNVLAPDNRFDAEAGRIESWDPNHQQFRCAGVAFMRTTIERNGLHLPVYSNAPILIYVVRGRGVFSVVIPGCAETFEDSGEQGGQSRRSQDRHQKIRHFREGDILAVPAGVAYWLYNNGDSEIVTVSLIDTSNVNNQLDKTPRKFALAGNPRQPFEQAMGQRGESRRGQEQGNNMFSGFDTEFLVDILQLNTETVRKLQGQNDNRKNIVRVEKGELGFLSPSTSPEERQAERERESSRRGDNGFEETVCSMRLRENIGDASRADVFNPQAGRLATLNSNNLPILSWLQLSAEKGTLYQNGIFVPHWEMNAHSIIYCTNGRGRIQVVDHNGNSVFNGELSEGQVLTVPQNFAVAKQAGNEGFEYIAFKTNDNAMVSPLMGRTSVLRGMPLDVLSNAFQIPNEEARRLKESPDMTFLVSSRRQSGRRYEA